MKKLSFDIPDAKVTFYEKFFSSAKSDQLLDRLTDEIKWQQDEIKMFGKVHQVPRLTAYYGDPELSYTYSGIRMSPHPWNEDLLYIKSKIEDQANVSFTSVLLNLYRSGQDSMGWHQDNEKELGVNPTIASVSFGATRTFQMKHIHRLDEPKVNIPLTGGSFLLMEGVTQHFWKHQIAKTKKVISPRINLTFRVVNPS